MKKNAVSKKDGDLSATEIIGKLRSAQNILYELISAKKISEIEAKKVIRELQQFKDPYMKKAMDEIEKSLGLGS